MSRKYKGQLTVNQDYAFTAIVELIDQGWLDYSRREKFLFVGLTAAAGYLSWYASIAYLDMSKKGGMFLPLGNFTPEFVGNVTLFTVFTFYLFFQISALTGMRNMYYRYQLAKKLGIAESARKYALRLGIGIFCALTTGIVFSFIADETHSLFDQIVSGFVSFVINFLGSLAIEEFVIFAFEEIKKRKDSQDKILFHVSDFCSSFVEHLFAGFSKLRKLSKEDVMRYDLLSLEGYKRYVLSPVQASYIKNSFLDKLMFGFSFVFHLSCQILTKVAIYSYFRKTVYSVGSSWDIQNGFGQWVLGSMLFLVYLSFTVKATYNCVQVFENLIYDSYIALHKFSKNPNLKSLRSTKFFVYSAAFALGVLSAFFAYVSSSSALYLNSEYDFTSSFEVSATCGGSVLINGYSFFIIIKEISDIILKYFDYDRNKREVINRHEKVCAFFGEYKKGFAKLSRSYVSGFSPLPQI